MQVDAIELNTIELNTVEPIDKNICCICLNTRELKCNYTKIDCCNQVLHNECLIDWITVSNSCPICRKSCKINKLIKLEEFMIYINNKPELIEKLIDDKKTSKKLLIDLYGDDFLIQIMNHESQDQEDQEELEENHTITFKSFFVQIYWMLSIFIFLVLIVFLFTDNIKIKS